MLVKAGARGGGLVQLEQGPPAGTRVVAAAASLFLDGDLVRPTDMATPKAPAAKAAPSK